MSNPIEVRGLVKTFGSARALDGLDLEVEAGEVHGFLGPNGAGKSTTIRVLLGLLRTDAGAVRVFGLDPWRDATDIHRRLAYVPGDVSLWPNLSGGETIDLLLRMRGVDPRTTRRAELLERFELDPTKKGRAYSKGNRQKVALVAAFAAPVDLLVLDEPTSGLDPLMEQVFNTCLAEHKAAGTTVLLSSHILSEVERLADRVTIIRAGRAVESGTLGELRHLRRNRVRAEVSGAVPDLRHLDGVHDVEVDGQVVTASVDPVGLPLPARRARRCGRGLAGQHPADAGGAVPRRLPEHAVSRGLEGTGLLLRFALRRDRVLATAWVLALSVMVLVSAAATGPLYATAADRVAAAEALNASPAVVALYGPILDTSSLGELSMTKMTVLYAVFVAFMGVVLVRRHTRVEEETGRAELVGATAVGATRRPPQPCSRRRWPRRRRAARRRRRHRRRASVAGSLLFGASWTGIGLVGAAVALLAAQVSSSARSVGFIASAAIGALYLLRAVGDTSATWLSWLTPFGWGPSSAPGPSRGCGCSAATRCWPRRWRGWPSRCGAAATSARASYRTAPDRPRARPASATRSASSGDSRAPPSSAGPSGSRHRRLMGSIVPASGTARQRPARPIVEAMGGVGGLQDALVVGARVGDRRRDHLLRHLRGRPARPATSATDAPRRCWRRPPPGGGCCSPSPAAPPRPPPGSCWSRASRPRSGAAGARPGRRRSPRRRRCGWCWLWACSCCRCAAGGRSPGGRSSPPASPSARWGRASTCPAGWSGSRPTATCRDIPRSPWSGGPSWC